MKTYINKIKLSDDYGRVHIAYAQEKQGKRDDYTINSYDLPHPDLLNAIRALDKTVLSICELFGVFESHQIEVTGITFTHKEDNVGAVITSKAQLSVGNQVLNLNTPHRSFDGYSEHDEAVFNTLQKKALDLVYKEAIKYVVNGKRAQADLFEESEDRVKHELEVAIL